VVGPVAGLPRNSCLAKLLAREHLLARITARRHAADPKPSSFPRLGTASGKSKNPSIGSNSWWTAAVFSAVKMAALLDENRQLIAIFTAINKSSKE
jgi:hypothetical protein